MHAPSQPQHGLPSYRFGACTIDALRRELHVGGQIIAPQPLVFDMLLYLAQHPGRVVGKDELLASVWRSSFVTDSVLARAVMKARRAINDLADPPQLLITVRGLGYRLDARVTEFTAAPHETAAAGATHQAPAARPRLAILPFVNATGEPSLNWAALGLAGLTHHQLSAGADSGLLALAALSAWQASDDRAQNRIDEACTQFGVDQALACTLLRGSDGLRIEANWGGPKQALQRRCFDGADLLALCAELVQTLGHDLATQLAPEQAGSFWEEQVARALVLDRKGQPRQALALLEACMDRLPASAAIHLLHARLLRKGVQLSEARQAAELALQTARQDDDHSQEAASQIELTRIDTDEGKFQSAKVHCDEAQRLVNAGKIDVQLRPDLLIAQSALDMNLGRHEPSMRAAEQALTAAHALGDSQLGLEASAQLGHTLLYKPNLPRAIELLQRAASEAKRRELAGIELECMRKLATAFNFSRRYRASIDAAHRASTLATALGNEQERRAATGQGLFSLVESGRIEDGQRQLEQYQQELGTNIPARLAGNLARLQAELCWRQGRSDEAIRLLADLLGDKQRQVRQTKWYCLSDLCRWYLLTDQQAAASDALAHMHDDPDPCRLARSRAEMALTQGRRGEAKAILREAWSQQSLSSESGQNVTIDLAWLHLEDGETQELEMILGPVLVMSDEHRATALLLRVHGWLQQGLPKLAAPQWQALTAEIPALQRRLPWFCAEEQLLQLLQGAARPLPVLLDSACF